MGIGGVVEQRGAEVGREKGKDPKTKTKTKTKKTKFETESGEGKSVGSFISFI
ncbi:hypothetical protein CCACVL1_11786 [Corchorus capsularis]|uniref:Uncharacterized protein n=1 Tax=Corchorus capsularis TaxID=210143 RepID=A0A1R3IJJ6_COCAP|nr:hypothetical protein CCACVL1_11786 [Corchorus capsularis]